MVEFGLGDFFQLLVSLGLREKNGIKFFLLQLVHLPESIHQLINKPVSALSYPFNPYPFFLSKAYILIGNHLSRNRYAEYTGTPIKVSGVICTIPFFRSTPRGPHFFAELARLQVLTEFINRRRLLARSLVDGIMSLAIDKGG